jgi:lysozyme family protein
MSNFDKSLKLVLKYEGEWSDHPKDLGGATNKGITLKTYRAKMGSWLTKADLRGISDHQIAKIYREDYWDKIRGDELPPGVAYCVFDAAVNSGPSRSSKWLQHCLGCAEDGRIGNITLGLVKGNDASALIDKMCDERMMFLESLPTWDVFGRGWKRRVEAVREAAKLMED